MLFPHYVKIPLALQKTLCNKKDKSFSILINRFKWESSNRLKKKEKPLRVETILFFRWVLSVKSRGFKQKRIE